MILIPHAPPFIILPPLSCPFPPSRSPTKHPETLELLLKYPLSKVRILLGPQVRLRPKRDAKRSRYLSPVHTPRLQAAGWDCDPHSIAEQRVFTDGRIVVHGCTARRRPGIRADYIL